MQRTEIKTNSEKEWKKSALQKSRNGKMWKRSVIFLRMHESWIILRLRQIILVLKREPLYSEGRSFFIDQESRLEKTQIGAQ